MKLAILPGMSFENKNKINASQNNYKRQFKVLFDKKKVNHNKSCLKKQKRAKRESDISNNLDDTNFPEYNFTNEINACVSDLKNLPAINNAKMKNFNFSREDDLFDVSENLTDNCKSINKIMSENLNICGAENEPAYLSQFDVQTFDSVGNPSAPNDIYQSSDKSRLVDLERQLSYKEGWSQYDQCGLMSYGILPENELMHDNMVPSYSTKHGYGSNDLHNEHVMNLKNQLFTGNLKDTWKNKQEVEPHFKPVASLSYIYGTPVRSDDELTRYIPSQYRQHEKIFDDVKVTPGVNLDYNEVGTHGFHSMHRPRELTVDDLRIKPKITYEGRIINGMKGKERPIQAPVMTYKPPTFKINTSDDVLPTSNVNTAPKVRDNFIMKETDRANQHFEYTGGAYTSNDAVGRNVPEYMREKYKYSTRQNFTLPKPLQKFARTETQYNPNLNSYDLPFNARAQTGCTNYIGGATNAQGNGSMYANMMDNARTTTKETTASQPNKYTHVAPNTMRGTVHPMDIANPTIKETTIENKLNPNITMDTKQRVYYSDVAKPTTKETTIDQIAPSNSQINSNIYASWTDVAKITTKESTVQTPYQTMVTPVNQQQRTPHPQDVARTTIKEQTAQIPYQTTITPINQQQGSVGYQDVARTTIKEQTVQVPYQTTITPINQQQRAPHPQDVAKTTTKEQTVQIPYQTTITPINQHQGKVNSQDIARTTMKEQTVQTPWNTFVIPVNQQQGAVGPQDIARTTIKEQTVQTPWNTFVVPVDQHQGSLPLQDIARTTTREQTVQIPHQTTITPVNQHQGAVGYQDVARITTKEQTVQIPYQTMVTPVNQYQGSVGYQDSARTTIKEQTVQIPYQTIITPANQQQGSVGYQDVARTTTKEQTVQTPYQTMVTSVGQSQGRAGSFNHNPLRATLKEQTVQIPYNTHVTAVGQQQRAPNPSDRARTTTKEQTVQIPYNTHIVAVGQHQRAPNPQDVARTTVKEQTVQIPYNTHLTGTSQQGKAGAFNRTPLRQTTKETTIDNDYIGAPTNDVNGKGFGYLSEKMYAPNTNKQFTCQEVYIAPLQGTPMARPYNDAYNARVDDRKEKLHWYRPPTNSGASQGPTAEQMNVSLRSDNHETQNLMPVYSVNHKLDRMATMTFSKAQGTISSDRFIDPVLIEQLKTNQYNIPNMHTQ